MPDERVHQLGFNAERAGCNKRHQVHQSLLRQRCATLTTIGWRCCAQPIGNWQAETRARGKTRGLPTSSVTACLWIAIRGEVLGSRYVQGHCQACTRKGNHADSRSTSERLLARWMHDQSSSKVQSGSARPMIEDAASVPK